jgi:hypothetical protein
MTGVGFQLTTALDIVSPVNRFTRRIPIAGQLTLAEVAIVSKTNEQRREMQRLIEV